MLRSAKNLTGYSIKATDGEIGDVHELLFDDHRWILRYLVADTGGWLVDRLVLISPASLEKPLWDEKSFPVSLTKKQVENSPPISADEPVDRQHETALTGYYQWPVYWNSGFGYYPAAGYPVALPYITKQENELAEERKEKADPNLRSTKDVIGYNIHATDGDIGHVEDFIIDDETWDIRYMVVDTRNWLPGGQKVLISPLWIDRIDWADSKVYLELTQEKIKSSPEFSSEEQINRDYEQRLFEYYDRPKYW